MNSSANQQGSQPLEPEFQAIVETVQTLAQARKGDSLELLALLRLLESLHQEIRDSLFQESLPDNRQALYHLLRDIEASGGWPYIHRMRLQTLLANLQDVHQDTHNGEHASDLSVFPPSTSLEAGKE